MTANFSNLGVGQSTNIEQRPKLQVFVFCRKDTRLSVRSQILQ
jgi:hypothetical protein